MKTRYKNLFWAGVISSVCLNSVGSLEASSFLYWTESVRDPSFTSTSIMRSGLDGSNVEVVMTQGTSENTFGGIAIDSANGYLYSGTRAALFRANLDGTGRIDLVPAINQVADIDLDLTNGKIYWSEGGSGVNAIYRANLDGSGKETLLNIGFAGLLEGIALDVPAGKLYFSRNINAGSDSIEVMNMDGTGVSVIHSLGSALPNPYDVDLSPDGQKVVWGQYEAPFEGVFQANKDGTGSIETIIATSLDNGLAIDDSSQTVFFGGPTSPSGPIQSIGINGSGFATVVPNRPFVAYLAIAEIRSVPDTGSTLAYSVVGLGVLGFLRRRSAA